MSQEASTGKLLIQKRINKMCNVVVMAIFTQDLKNIENVTMDFVKNY